GVARFPVSQPSDRARRSASGAAPLMQGSGSLRSTPCVPPLLRSLFGGSCRFRAILLRRTRSPWERHALPAVERSGGPGVVALFPGLYCRRLRARRAVQRGLPLDEPSGPLGPFGSNG